MGHPIHKHMNSGMSRKASPLNDFKGGYHKVEHAKGEAHKSPANNITYGDKSGPTGYIGEERKDLMKDNPVARTASGNRPWIAKHYKSGMNYGSAMKMGHESPAKACPYLFDPCQRSWQEEANRTEEKIHCI